MTAMFTGAVQVTVFTDITITKDALFKLFRCSFKTIKVCLIIFSFGMNCFPLLINE